MEGTIRKIMNWKNSKGFFFKINETDKDFFAYGMPTFKISDRVEFDLQDRTLNKATMVRFVKEKPFELIQPIITGKPIPSQQELEIRLSCLWAASTLCANKGYSPNEVLTVAKRFETYARGD